MAKAKDEEKEVLTAGDKAPEPSKKETEPAKSKDEQINEVGKDAPKVEKPVAAKVEKPAPLTTEDLRYALRTLAGLSLSNADMDALKKLQPRIFGD